MSLDKYILPTGSEVSYGKNLYILGTSEDGPLYEPMNVKSPTQAMEIFGNKKIGNLIKAYNEAYQVTKNSINIYLVRVAGSQSYFEMRNEDLKTLFLIKSKNPGELYNNITITINETNIEINTSKKYVFEFDKYPTLDLLARGINNTIDILIANSYDRYIKTDYMVEYYKDNLGTSINFKYGDNGVNISKNELHQSLDIAYNVIEGQPIDVLCVADMYFDDISPLLYYSDSAEYSKAFYTQDRDYLTLPHKDFEDKTATFHGQLIDFCYRQLNNAIVTHGVIAFNPLENIEDIFETDAYLNKVIFGSCFSDRFDLISKQNGQVVDHGKFISVTIGEFEYKSIDNIPYYNNAYIGYAALLASQLTAQSTTNQIVPNIKKLRYHLEDHEMKLLSSIGVTTFRHSVMKDNIVVGNGVSAEREGSPYHVVSNVRMVQTIITYFKVLLDDFVGENVEKLIATKSMNKAIEQLIKNLKSEKVVKNIQYQLDINRYSVATLRLNVMAKYSIEYVSATGSTKL